PPVDASWSEMPLASTDFANVSQRLPSVAVQFAIAPRGTSWHSRRSLEAARSPDAKAPLAITIDVMAEVATRLCEDGRFGDEAKREFASA
ncbi:MAG TPA: hypothetical protein VEY12_00900, partial [Thermoplasmata archaeon]|nr:hypothetical protein [Thermoplasmata archaeon]